MRLYILRHAIAETRQSGKDDARRKITKEGRTKLEWVLARARSAKVAPAVILTSPLARAVQTAQAAAKALAPKARIEQTEALAPASTPKQVWTAVAGYASEGDVLIAGHEPLLGETVSYLLGVARGVVDLKKGALACLEFDSAGSRARGVLCWLITPGICRPEEAASKSG